MKPGDPRSKQKTEGNPDALSGDDHPKAGPVNPGQLPKIISFDSLARCGEELWIENNGQIYRLRRTKQGKLILTK